MIASFPQKVTFSQIAEILLEIDKELAEKTHAKGCPYCGGKLDKGYYRRYPAGSPLDKLLNLIRFSFCCREEGCRKRVLPPSCIFFGRKVYWSCIILVSVALQQLNVKTAEQVEKRLGVSLRTLRRWMAFFRSIYLQSRAWFLRQGFIPVNLSAREVIGGLYKHYVDQKGELSGLVAFLSFMAIDP
ncbi:hypothetical protein ACFL27_16685 [candidate division CSSED10-310 bacterium]|uniref:Transposase n=1 Tax=candidate division CSSED10-310 bacterium TaxID=2855610 RepID=A0ABV6Z059_UNCC1